MIEHLSNEDTFKFIELYKNEPTIWDLNSKTYKDKQKVQSAWERIAGEMGISITSLRKRRDSLMSTYRMHQRKRQMDIQSGTPEKEILAPSWIYYNPMDAFLKPLYEGKVVVNSDSQSKFVSDKKFKFISIEDVVEQDQEQYEANEDVNTLDQNTIQTYTIQSQDSNPPELIQAEKAMQTAFDTLNQVLAEKNTEDEYDLYGKLLVTRLRKFSPIERQEIMHELDGVLLKHSRNKASELEPSSKRARI